MSTERTSLAWGQMGQGCHSGTRRALSSLLLSPLCASVCFLLAPHLLGEVPVHLPARGPATEEASGS